MINCSRMLCSAILTVVSILTLCTLLACSSGVAEVIPLDVVGHSNDWMQNFTIEGIGQDPSLAILPDEGNSLQITRSSGEIWVTISPFTASLSGQKTNIVAGYLSGDRNGATITIAGKNPSDTDFSDISTIKPDENGLFVWAVPAVQKDMDLFRVTAKSGSNEVLSNAIRFTPGGEDAVIEPVVAPVTTTPVQTQVPIQTQIRTQVPTTVQTQIQTQVPTQIQTQPPTPVPTGGTSGPGSSTITISASTTTPAVGQLFQLSGRLTDQNGNGISGATVTINDTGYVGAYDTPFATAQTGSDGSFVASVGVATTYTVGMVAVYGGDANHSPAQSNILMFTGI